MTRLFLSSRRRAAYYVLLALAVSLVAMALVPLLVYSWDWWAG